MRPEAASTWRAHLEILRHLLARRRRDLHEGHLAALARVVLQQRLVGAQALGDPLGVVEPVDADDQLAAEQAARQRAGSRAPPRPRSPCGAKSVGVDADREVLRAQRAAEGVRPARPRARSRRPRGTGSRGSCAGRCWSAGRRDRTCSATPSAGRARAAPRRPRPRGTACGGRSRCGSGCRAAAAPRRAGSGGSRAPRSGRRRADRGRAARRTAG